MRTFVEIKCPFGRDISWITPQLVEQYAGACLRGKSAAESEGLVLCGHNFSKFELLKELLNDYNKQFVALKDELLEEYGIDYFMRSKHKLEHVRDLEALMEQAAASKNFRDYATLLKELRGLRGWEEKPREPAPAPVVNVFSNQQVAIDRHNPREVERYYQSIMG